METYLSAFIRAAQEGKDFCGMPAWKVKIIVEDMLKERDAAIAARDAAIRKESKWISVKERLPEDMQRVLVSIYGFTCPTLYTADFIKREIGGIFVPVYDDLTAEHPMSMSQYSISMAEFDIQPSHWMPLPEPPVGKEGEE